MPHLGVHSQNNKSCGSKYKGKASWEVFITMCHTHIWLNLCGVAVLEKCFQSLTTCIRIISCWLKDVLINTMFPFSTHKHQGTNSSAEFIRETYCLTGLFCFLLSRFSKIPDFILIISPTAASPGTFTQHPGPWQERNQMYARESQDHFQVLASHRAPLRRETQSRGWTGAYCALSPWTGKQRHVLQMCLVWVLLNFCATQAASPT